VRCLGRRAGHMGSWRGGVGIDCEMRVRFGKGVRYLISELLFDIVF